MVLYALARAMLALHSEVNSCYGYIHCQVNQGRVDKQGGSWSPVDPSSSKFLILQLKAKLTFSLCRLCYFDSKTRSCSGSSPSLATKYNASN